MIYIIIDDVYDNYNHNIAINRTNTLKPADNNPQMSIIYSMCAIIVCNLASCFCSIL